MAVYKRGDTFWYSFVFAGKRIQESSKSSRRTIAVDKEKDRRKQLERAYAGLPIEEATRRILSIRDLTGPYLERYRINHRAASVKYCRSSLKNIERLLGRVLLPDLTEDRILQYMAARVAEGAANRTVNAELAELSRSIGHPWHVLWPKVKRREETRDVGKALTAEQEQALIAAAEAAAKRKKGVMMPALIRLALMTGMRAEELTSLRWAQVDFGDGMIRVGKAKTAAGTGREIPMNAVVQFTMEKHLAWWSERFGEARPELCVFPGGHPQPKDPEKPITTLKHAWESIREAAGVECRWHDLRHTFCTKLAERGTPESTMLALMGHMSRAMLERYSHIRVAAKREAVGGITLQEPGARATENPVSTKSSTQTKAATLQ